MLKLGFAKTDITPRVGVELCGFGPFINRQSVAIRDQLWARAMAAELGDQRLVVISNDLIQLDLAVTERVRDLIIASAPLDRTGVMVHCTHTHSGPATGTLAGWGQQDPPYLETLPRRLATAALAALDALEPATLCHAEVPCEGIGYNREYDGAPPELADALRDDWRPSRPELTDTTCHVLAARQGDRLLGFASYFGCHPVVCCADCRYISGDYAGVATNLLEREFPGAVGLFLQGAQGDVNTCVVHHPQQASLLALDVIAGRYARAVRSGLKSARPLSVEALRGAIRPVTFTRQLLSRAELQARLDEHEAVLHAPEASDEAAEVRMATVYALACRQLLRQHDAGISLQPLSQVQGLRLGPVALLGGPFEIFQAIKNEVQAGARSAVPLVMGITNDQLGYAPDHQAAARGGYAADVVPFMLGNLPFAAVHDELVKELLTVESELY